MTRSNLHDVPGYHPHVSELSHVLSLPSIPSPLLSRSKTTSDWGLKLGAAVGLGDQPTGGFAFTRPVSVGIDRDEATSVSHGIRNQAPLAPPAQLVAATASIDHFMIISRCRYLSRHDDLEENFRAGSRSFAKDMGQERGKGRV